MTDQGRYGDWMQTYTGRAFWPLSARPEDVHPADIAHALSMISRYGGHAQVFYSVAEHSVLISRALPERYGLWGLLHDAAEAYIGDMVRPLKHAPEMAPFRLADKMITEAVCDRFGLDRRPYYLRDIKEADLRILVDERAALMSDCVRPWTAIEGVEPLGVTIKGWSPAEAEAEFLTRFAELGGTYE